MTKERVLFIDDEPNVLSGLRRMLRGARERWDMTFVDSGAKALEIVDREPVDVVVSDMRMPEMDGAQVLAEVRRRRPDTARIILSGYAEKEAVFRTVGPAHQYLAKPCDADFLIDTIERTVALRRFLACDKLRALVSVQRTLPSPPSVFFQLLDELNAPAASPASVADIIATDVAMAAQTLKLTNSAYFALAREVTTPLQAVQLLGFETIKSLVLVANIFQQSDGAEETTSVLQRLSRRCLDIGTLASAIARAEGLDKTAVDQSACAGVLSHVGTLLLVADAPAKFAEATTMAENEGVGIIEAERRVFGATHADLGAYLLGLWGFTDPIVEAVAHHHEPSSAGRREICPLTALHSAQYLTRSNLAEQNESDALGYALDRAYLAAVGAADHLPLWNDTFKSLAAREVVA